MDSLETEIYKAVIAASFLLSCLFAYFTISIVRLQRKWHWKRQLLFKNELELIEEERNRIAMDLHDELGSLLTMTDLQIAKIPAKGRDPEKLKVQAHENLRHAIARMRHIIRNLSTLALSRKGIHYALREFLQQTKKATGINISLQLRLKQSLGGEMELHIYRMIQEIVHNTVRHSEASDMEIVIVQHKGKIYILCQDNGKGMSGRAKSIQEGLGIHSLLNRVEMMGGQINISSKRGIEYYIVLPVSRSHEQDHQSSGSG